MMNQSRVIVEICTASIESVRAASNGGADRIELCSALQLGGLSPSQALIQSALEFNGLQTFVLIRPREGDFTYSRAEFELMLREIELAKTNGAHGIVTGMLLIDGTVDTCRMKALIDASRPLSVTFHRAFDLTPDPDAALKAIISLGCDRVLTSGQALNVEAGLEMLTHLVNIAGNEISILAGGGVSSKIAFQLYKARIREFHLSASALIPGRMKLKNNTVKLGKNNISENLMLQTNEELVHDFVQNIKQIECNESD